MDWRFYYPVSKLIDQMLDNNFFNEEINLAELLNKKDEIKRIHKANPSDIEQAWIIKIFQLIFKNMAIKKRKSNVNNFNIIKKLF